MDFNGSKPIFIQIADNICERILGGEYKAGDRIPSVREWGATIGVNPNTVVRSYDILTERGVIHQQRGIGYFVNEDACQSILEMERRNFIENELPAMIKRAEILGINLKEILA